MRYEPDDGPLTDEQLDAIRAASSATNTPEELFTESLFDKIAELPFAVVVDNSVPPGTIVLMQKGHEDKAVIGRLNSEKGETKMSESLLQTMMRHRETARLQSPKETYPILTRIIGDYELGAKAKKPRTGDDALVLIIKGILAGNTETIALLKKSQGGEKEHASEIQRLETQSRLLQNYIPAKAEAADNPDLLTEEQYREILAENSFDKLGLFHAFLKANYAGRTEGAVATRVFNAVQKEKAE